MAGMRSRDSSPARKKVQMTVAAARASIDNRVAVME